MRLERGVYVAGVEPELARKVALICCGNPVFVERVAMLTHLDLASAEAAVHQLGDAGFLESQEWPEDEILWRTTTAGNFLANAKFLKPIGRAKADELLREAIGRANAYNADPTKLLWIDQIAVFGSFIDPAATDHADLNLNLTTSRRLPDQDWGAAIHRYARESGRNLPLLQDVILWPLIEVGRVVKGRSRYISINEQPVSELVDGWQLVYSRRPGGADHG